MDRGHSVKIEVSSPFLFGDGKRVSGEGCGIIRYINLNFIVRGKINNGTFKFFFFRSRFIFYC